MQGVTSGQQHRPLLLLALAWPWLALLEQRGPSHCMTEPKGRTVDGVPVEPHSGCSSGF